MNQIVQGKLVIRCGQCGTLLGGLPADRPVVVTCARCGHKSKTTPQGYAVAASRASGAPASYQAPAAPPLLPAMDLNIDATESRAKFWGRAQEITDGILCAVPGQLRLRVTAHGGSQITLYTDYATDYERLRPQLRAVQPKGGLTQIVPLMRRACGTPGLKVWAYIGDASEDDFEKSVALARSMLSFGCRTIVLYEANNGYGLTNHGYARQYFTAIAEAGGGTVIPFCSDSPALMRDWLAAIAAFAVGGLPALEERKDLPAAKLLLGRF